MAAASYYNKQSYRQNRYDGSSDIRDDRRQSDMMRHPQDRFEDPDIEEIHREHPPELDSTKYDPRRRQMGPNSETIYGTRRNKKNGGSHHPNPRRTHSLGNRHDRKGRRGDYHHSRDEDPRRRPKHTHDRRSRRSYSRSSSRTPSPRPRRRKSLSEQALNAFGLDGAGVSDVKSGGHRHDRPRDYDRYDDHDFHGHNHADHNDRPRLRRDRHRRDSSASSRSRHRNHSRPKNELRNSLTPALTAALTAGVTEAYRVRKDPGGWSGEKGKRILTAAVGAGGADKLIGGRDSDKHSKKHGIESTLAGLATSHLMGGTRRKSRSHTNRRSHSESRDGIKGAGVTSLLAAAGQKAYDSYRSKSRGRSRNTDYSSDEASPRRHQRATKHRSQSVSEYVNKGLSALRLGDDHGATRHTSSPSDGEYSDFSPPRRDRRRSRHRF